MQTESRNFGFVTTGELFELTSTRTYWRDNAPSIQFETIPGVEPDLVRQPIAPTLIPKLDSRSMRSFTLFATWSLSTHE